MTINGINRSNTQMKQKGMNQATDSYSRNIQNQIANAQKQLQELSSNDDMTQEEKNSKRQELQQQISDLNVQLRQHQTEQLKENQQKRSSQNNTTGKNQKSDAADMGVILSLSTAKEQLADMKKVRTELQGKLRISKNEEEKADLREKIDNITQNISSKANETQDTISDHQKTKQDNKDKTKDDEKENETNIVSEKDNGNVEVKSAKNTDDN